MPRRWRARPESWWWISAVVLVPVVVLTGLTALLLVSTTHPGTASEQLDLVRLALSVGAGTGGVVALVLAGRRQWHAEQAQRATEQSHQAAEHDETQRRITDLYTKAADQLGSDKAPVRLAGLYALERVAQDNPGQRQTIVNVICAYLRMPYDVPGTSPAGDATSEARKDYRDTVQEKQVRLTAQRILATHLRPGEDLDRPAATFWPDIDLDLTGATVINFDLNHCCSRDAGFVGAQFAGSPGFERATFTDDAWFDGARFAGDARFDGARFAGNAWFGGAQFAGNAWFDGAQFTGDARFGAARFTGSVRFDSTVTFASQEPEFACWVRLDVPDDVADNRAWVAGWVVTPVAERLTPDAAGAWGQLSRHSHPRTPP
jgi:Pentapeptide repeats (9 copies)